MTRVAEEDAQVPPLSALQRITRSPGFTAALLTILGLGGGAIEPWGGSQDGSWMIGLTLARLEGLAFGPDLVFTYGPLGFLGVPMTMDRGLLTLGLLFTLVATFTLYLVVVRWLRTWLGGSGTIIMGVLLTLVASRLPTVHLAGAAIILWVLWFIRGEEHDRPTPLWILAVLSAACSLLLLIQFSLGFLGLAVVALAMVSAPRFARLAVVVASAIGGLTAFWILAGQPLANLPVWFSRSVEVALGYTAAMSHRRVAPNLSTLWPSPAHAIVLLGIIGFGCWLAFRGKHRYAVASSIVITLGCWLFLKESFVRFDPGHAYFFLPFAALIVVALPWERRFRVVGIAGIGLSVFVVVTIHGGPVALLTARADSVSAYLSGASLALDDARHQEHLSERRTAMRMNHPVSPTVIDALRDRDVHAEPWDVSAVSANELRWHPLPMFQGLTAYTPGLDDMNAQELTAPDGPSGVLLETDAYSIDARHPRWSSPAAQVALACNFTVVAEQEGWQAAVRTPDRCGTPTLLERQTVQEGETVEVPEPSDPNNLVVARFHLAKDPVDALIGLLFRPLRKPTVITDLSEYSLVVATAAQPHLVRQPAEVAGQHLPFDALESDSLRLTETLNDTTIEFIEIPMT